MSASALGLDRQSSTARFSGLPSSQAIFVIGYHACPTRTPASRYSIGTRGPADRRASVWLIAA